MKKTKGTKSLSASHKASATAFAPATVANVSVGFDLLGLAIDGLGDTVRVTRIKERKIIIHTIHGSGVVTDAEVATIPLDPENNTATVGLLQMLEDLNLKFGFELEIYKGIPLGSGLGGSAASAVAGIVAANELLSKPLKKSDLFKYALMGEEVASGSRHGDNVGPALYGGLVIAPADMTEVVPVKFPKNLRVVVVHPGFRLDTKEARGVLPEKITLKEHIVASSRLAQFLVACASGKVTDLGHDDLIEPARAHLIPGFNEVKKAALKAGAVGSSISGAGPAVFALCSLGQEKKIAQAMAAAFTKAGHKTVHIWTSPLSPRGARVVKK